MNVRPEQLQTAFETASVRATQHELSGRALAVESVVAEGTVFAGTNALGEWALVIPTRYSPEHSSSLFLATFTAEFGVRYLLDHGDDRETLRVSILRCTSHDPSVRDLFVAFCVALLESVSETTTDGELAETVDRWVSLFWRLGSPAQTDVVGLIGELVVLEAAPNTGLWVRAWHASKNDTLDFVLPYPPLEVEVKASRGQERIHFLSLHQAVGAPSTPRFIASVLVELRESGETIGNLAHEIADRLAGENELQLFWSGLAEVCGSSLDEFLTQRFVRRFASETLQFYDAKSVPQPVVELPLPVGVSQLKFRSDFSSSVPVASSVVFRA